MISQIDELNEEMALLLERLKTEAVPPQIAGEMNRAFANMIRSCQVEINYAIARGEKPNTTMLNKKPEPKLSASAA
jgi:hypothetical protein